MSSLKRGCMDKLCWMLGVMLKKDWCIAGACYLALLFFWGCFGGLYWVFFENALCNGAMTFDHGLWCYVYT